MARTDPRKHKSQYGTPKAGTKRAKLVELLLRPQGASDLDALTVGARIHNEIPILRDECGYDIHCIGTVPSPVPYSQKRNKKFNVYRIIGRYEWNGTYISYL